MKRRDEDVVSATEIAQWAWCPESWRLELLGHRPGNERALRRGEKRHSSLARFEGWSAVATKLGLWLLVLALLLVALALVLVMR